MNVYNIAIADDNSFLISSIKEKLSFFEDLKLVLTAFNGKELVDKVEVNKHVDLILMDVEMPVMNGIQAVHLIKKKFPHIKIIMLTVFDNDEHIYQAIKAGAEGYLLKEIHPKDLHRGIIQTLEGGAAMSPNIAMKTLRLLKSQENALIPHEEKVKLTKREVEVLEQLSQSLSYTAIAENLFVSPATVRTHIENIYKKLEVHSKLEAVQKAKDFRII